MAIYNDFEDKFKQILVNARIKAIEIEMNRKKDKKIHKLQLENARLSQKIKCLQNKN